jgi:hypothetical protein
VAAGGGVASVVMRWRSPVSRPPLGIGRHITRQRARSTQRRAIASGGGGPVVCQHSNT